MRLDDIQRLAAGVAAGNEIPGNLVHWGRSDVDGVPYLGVPQMYRDNREFADKTVKVGVPQVKTFDMRRPEDAAEYVKVLVRIFGGQAVAIHVHRMITEEKQLVYFEWADLYYADKSGTGETNGKH